MPPGYFKFVSCIQEVKRILSAFFSLGVRISHLLVFTPEFSTSQNFFKLALVSSNTIRYVILQPRRKSIWLDEQ